MQLERPRPPDQPEIPEPRSPEIFPHKAEPPGIVPRPEQPEISPQPAPFVPPTPERAPPEIETPPEG